MKQHLLTKAVVSMVYTPNTTGNRPLLSFQAARGKFALQHQKLTGHTPQRIKRNERIM